MGGGMMSSVSEKVAAPKEDYRPEIVIFDDRSDFAWLAELELAFPNLLFRKLPSFEMVDAFLSEYERGEIRSPDILAIDVHCDPSEPFEILDPGEPLQENRGGFQLYRLVLRRSLPMIDEIPTLFFTSYPEGVHSYEARQLAKEFGSHIFSTSRRLFNDKLLELCRSRGWITQKDIRQSAGPDQEDYLRLFDTLSNEFGMTPEERCAVLGIISGDVDDIPTVVKSTDIANERIELLLAISVLLDELVEPQDKRIYLLRHEPGEARLGDLLLAGTTEDLLRVKAVLEARLGGQIL